MTSRWKELSRASFRTAKHTLDAKEDDYLRSAISRFYYAAYSALAAKLPHGQQDHPRGRSGPSHAQLPKLIDQIRSLTQSERTRIKTDLNFLRQARETADYRPGLSISRNLALQCLHRAAYICKAMGVFE